MKLPFHLLSCNLLKGSTPVSLRSLSSSLSASTASTASASGSERACFGAGMLRCMHCTTDSTTFTTTTVTTITTVPTITTTIRILFNAYTVTHNKLFLQTSLYFLLLLASIVDLPITVLIRARKIQILAHDILIRLLFIVINIIINIRLFLGHGEVFQGGFSEQISSL
jgi:hypothetical protein